MKCNNYFISISISLGLISILAGCSSPPAAKTTTSSNTVDPSTAAIISAGSWKATPADVPAPVVEAVLASVKTAASNVNTFSADFSYAVTSAKQQQLITGKVLMMKPNFLRITYNYMAHPAFPNPIASDGEKIYTFRSKNFLPNRTFSEDTFDPILGAKYASGLLPGGGIISTSSVAADGRNLHLWDAIPLQAFFSPDAALHYLYYNRISEVKGEGEKNIAGVNYRVLAHHFQNGNIAGGESSSFDQHLYVGPDNLIHMYVLEFTSAGNRGVQVMRFSNIQTNLPLTRADFVFTPPTDLENLK